MSRQRIHWDTRDSSRRHREKIAAKYEKIQTLRALLEMWEAKPDEAGHDYILALRAKLRSAENQLATMTI